MTDLTRDDMIHGLRELVRELRAGLTPSPTQLHR